MVPKGRRSARARRSRPQQSGGCQKCSGPLKTHLLLPRQLKAAEATLATKKPSAFTKGFNIKVVTEAGFIDLAHFLRRRRDLIARIQGRRPLKHRRRTTEDVDQILKMTKEGLPNKEIAKQLDLSRTTVSNVRKQLRVQGKL